MVTPRPWELPAAPPAVLASREPIVRFFSYHDAHPIAIVMVLMKEFGHDWFGWAPEALRKEILTSFRATSVSEQNWQKIQAARTLFLATGYWAEWEVFEKINQAFNNNVPTFDVLQRCTLGQLMAGVDIANQLRDETFSDEVMRYVACCAVDQGVTYLPSPLDFAQAALSQPQYECLDCGKVGDVDFDGFDRCDDCSRRYDGDRFLASTRKIREEGKNIRRFFLRDPEKVKARFEALKDKTSAQVDPENAEDVQAVKLTVAYQYMQQRRRELVEQLEELKSWVTQ